MATLLGAGCGRTSLDAWLDEAEVSGANPGGRGGASGVGGMGGAGGRLPNVSGAAGAAGTFVVAGQAGFGGSIAGSAGASGAGGAPMCQLSPADCYGEQEPECRGQVPPCEGAVLGHLVVSAASAAVLDISTSVDGRVAIGGYFQGSLAVDGKLVGVTSNGDDGFVLVFDKQRKLIWSRSLAGPGAQSVTGVDFTPDGDLVLQATDDKAPDASAQRPHGAGMVMRLAHDGKTIWTYPITQNDINPGRIAVDNDGAITAVGGYQTRFRSLDFAADDASYAGYVLHLAGDGTGLWLHSSKPVTWRTSGLQNVVIDDEDNIIVTGYGVRPNNEIPTYIQKFSTKEQLEYMHELTASEYMTPTALTVDRHMQVVMGGEFRERLPIGDFVLQTTEQYVNDPWLAKLDREGRWVWATSHAGSSTLRSWLWAVSADPQRNLITAEGQGASLVVRKLRESSKEVWSRSFDAPHENTVSVATDNAGNIWLAGNFAETIVVGDDKLVDTGDGSVFLLELSP